MLKDESDNVLVELINTSSGNYRAENFQIENDKTYRIEASVAGKETVTSETKIPKALISTFVEQDEQIYQDYLCRTFKIEIDDNPDEKNYYLVDGWYDILNGEHMDYQEEVNGYEIPHFGILTKDVNAENNSMSSTIDIIPYPLDFVFLTDENFNGEKYVLEFEISDNDITDKWDLEIKANLSVKSVNKELYEYYKSISMYKLSKGNPFGEPQPIFSNIDQGIGIFGGFTENEYKIDLLPTEFWFNSDFTIENDGCTAPCTVKFSAEMGDKVNFSWDFGDGNTSTEKNPEHTFELSGQYDVSLTFPLHNGSSQTTYGIIIK